MAGEVVEHVTFPVNESDEVYVAISALLQRVQHEEIPANSVVTSVVSDGNVTYTTLQPAVQHVQVEVPIDVDTSQLVQQVDAQGNIIHQVDGQTTNIIQHVDEHGNIINMQQVSVLLK